MPRYEYACTSSECGNKFELVQSFSDPAASECPVCGNGVRKVYGSVGVVFKGSGFYRTDSRAAAAKADGSSGKSESPSKSSDASSTPAKTADSKASSSSSSSSTATPSGSATSAPKAAAS